MFLFSRLNLKDFDQFFTSELCLGQLKNARREERGFVSTFEANPKCIHKDRATDGSSYIGT